MKFPVRIPRAAAERAVETGSHQAVLAGSEALGRHTCVPVIASEPERRRATSLCRLLSAELAQAALTASFPLAADSELDELVAAALDQLESLPSEAILRAIIAEWPRLSVRAREAVAGTVGDLLPAALEAHLRASKDEAAALAAGSAAAELLTLWRAHLPATAAHESSALERVLARGLGAQGGARHPAIIDAALDLAAHPGPAIREVLEDQSKECHWTLRARIKDRAASGAELLGWLGVPSLRGAARTKLESADGVVARQAIDSAHLLLAKGRAAQVGRFRMPDLATDHHDDAAASVAHRRSRLRWLRLTATNSKPICDEATRALCDHEPLVRLDAVRALSAGAPSRDKDDLLMDFALDDHEAVAGAAAASLAAVESPSRRAGLRERMRTLLRSPHARVRMLAQGALQSEKSGASDRAIATRREGAELDL